MTEGEKAKRPEFVGETRVKAPADYDFNTWGRCLIIKVKIFQSTINSLNFELMLSGKKNNSKIGFAAPIRYFLVNPVLFLQQKGEKIFDDRAR